MAALSRRNLLSGRWQRKSHVPRPPWSVAEAEFIEGCSRCHACIQQCESRVLIAGDGGFPELDFQQAECTFCRRCALACRLPLFTLTNRKPWGWVAAIQPNCLAYQGVACRSCQDHCEMSAIRFFLHPGGIAEPVVAPLKCSGCGACVRRCPANALQIVMPDLSLGENE